MEEHTAYCGLECSRCPIHLAGLETDLIKKTAMVKEIISICKEQYRIDYKIDDINGCDGCRSENGKLFIGCRNCDIRKCAAGKHLPNCACCNEYACDKLSEFLSHEPAARTRLDDIRKFIG